MKNCELKFDCYVAAAVKGEASVCGEIDFEVSLDGGGSRTKVYNQGLCYIAVAAVKNDQSVCDIMPEGELDHWISKCNDYFL